MKNALFLILLSIVVKGLFNGFEFITSTLVMMMTPLFFFWIKNKWQVGIFIRRFALYSLSALLGVVFNMALLSVQISIYEGDASAGIGHIIKSWQKRTYESGTTYQFDEQTNQSLASNVTDVLKIHFGNKAYRQWHPAPYAVSFGWLTVLFLIATLILWITGKYRAMQEDRRLDLALMVMAWVSFLAPLSWFIIFKGHAYVHITLDTLAWYFPFVIFGAAVTGRMLRSLFYTVMKVF